MAVFAHLCISLAIERIEPEMRCKDLVSGCEETLWRRNTGQ
jgi:hypothetical protein